MRLAALIPSISQELVDALESLHVQTSSDLLFHTAPLDLFLRLPPGLATLQEILQLRTLVTERASAPGSSGSQVLERHLSTIRRNRAVTSGIRVLDILFEGLDAAHLLHISGDRHVGKSAFAMHLALQNLLQEESASVLWIDTTGDLAPGWAHDTITRMGGDTGALERLRISLAFEIDTVYDVLDEMQANYEDGELSSTMNRYIVIDSITPLLGPQLSAESAEGHAAMVNFMRYLRNIARNYGVLFFLINGATWSRPDEAHTTSLPGQRKPALGPSFSYLPDATLWLSIPETNDPTLRLAEITAAKIVV